MKQNCLNVAYSFDDGYAQHAGVSILSLLENNKDIDDIVIYIITHSLSDENITRIENIIKIYNREVQYLDLNTITSRMGTNTQFHKSAYGRIFLDCLTNIDRIIYIDSDTVITGSLKELISIDITNCLVAGVQDTVNPYYILNIGLNLNHRYINDGGVIVLNLELWRKKEITNKCIDFIRKFNGNPPHNDQGTINAVCKGCIKILPACYNVMPPHFKFTREQIVSLFKMNTYYSQNELDEAVKNPIVIHYTDEFFNRPWFRNCTHPFKEVYLRYLSMTPWKDCDIQFKELTRNCKIQNWVHKNCPFFVYKSMIRLIELKHKIKK